MPSIWKNPCAFGLADGDSRSTRSLPAYGTALLSGRAATMTAVAATPPETSTNPVTEEPRRRAMVPALTSPAGGSVTLQRCVAMKPRALILRSHKPAGIAHRHRFASIEQSTSADAAADRNATDS